VKVLPVRTSVSVSVAQLAGFRVGEAGAEVDGGAEVVAAVVGGDALRGGATVAGAPPVHAAMSTADTRIPPRNERTAS
jgi:hypothetical protein